MGRAAAVVRAKAAEKLFVESISKKWSWVKKNVLLLILQQLIDVLHAISGTAIREVYFQVENWVKIILYCSCCAVSDERHGNIDGHLRTISFETAISCRTHQVEALPLFIPPLLPPTLPVSLRPSPCAPCVPCVELSELTSSIPTGVKLSYVSCGSCFSAHNNIRIRTSCRGPRIDLQASANPHTRDGITRLRNILLYTYPPLVFIHTLQI